jgi:hypothetical protein
MNTNISFFFSCHVEIEQTETVNETVDQSYLLINTCYWSVTRYIELSQRILPICQRVHEQVFR